MTGDDLGVSFGSPFDSSSTDMISLQSPVDPPAGLAASSPPLPAIVPPGANIPIAGTGYNSPEAIAAINKASPQLDAEQVKAGILAHLRRSEGANYNTLYGGGTFNSYTDHPRIGFTGPTGEPTHAAGGYQFQPATWDAEAKKLGLKDFSPASQDTAAWDLANTTYKANTGRDLTADAQSGKVNWGALGDQWASLKGKGAGPVPPARASSVASAGGSTGGSIAPGTASDAGAGDNKLMHAMLLMQLLAPGHKFIPVDYDPFKTQPHVGA